MLGAQDRISWRNVQRFIEPSHRFVECVHGSWLSGNRGCDKAVADGIGPQGYGPVGGGQRFDLIANGRLLERFLGLVIGCHVRPPTTSAATANAAPPIPIARGSPRRTTEPPW